ncbi:MAG: hypothetical protein WC668_00105 [Patescibacteria group bacterium]|jgi:hypothetical protein
MKTMQEQGVIPAIDGAEVVVYAQFVVDGVLNNIPLSVGVTPLEECPENPCRFMLDVTTFTPTEVPSKPWMVLLANGRGDLVEKRARSLINDGRETAVNFNRTVPVTWSEKHKCFTTMPQTNNLHLIGIDSLGRIVIWQAAIVSQMGKFFATLQKIGEHQAIWNGAGVYFPTVDWPQLNDWLAAQFMGWEQGEDGLLPEETLILNPPPPLPSMNCVEEGGMAESYSVVLFWNLSRGFGAIAMPNGEVARVHWTQVPLREDGLAYLKCGEWVKYAEVIPAQQIQDIHGEGRETSFQWEARGILVEQYPLSILERFRFSDEKYD